MAEMLYVVDEEDRIIGTMSRATVRKKGLLFRSSHIIVSNSKGEFFVQRRSANKDLWPNMYDLGVGETLKSGESYEEAAKRGLKEEIGADAEINFLFDFKFRSKYDNENCRVYRCCYDRKLKFADKEVAEGFFVTKEKLRKLMKTKPFTPFSNTLVKKYFEEKITKKEHKIC
jgi:isopentenyldiphosphate isomerase